MPLHLRFITLKEICWKIFTFLLEKSVKENKRQEEITKKKKQMFTSKHKKKDSDYCTKESVSKENYVTIMMEKREGLLYSCGVSHWALLLLSRHLKRRGLHGHLLWTTSGRNHDRGRL